MNTENGKQPANDQQWISVKDRLPDYEQNVLVWGKRKLSQPVMGGNHETIVWTSRLNTVGTSIHKQRERFVDEFGFRMMETVTHWMPIPPPPSTKKP